jgi:sugar lactone lactonase YvrE
MSPQHRALRIAAFAAIVTAMGCPAALPTDPNEPGSNVVKNNLAISASPAGAGVKGKVLGEGGKAASGVNVMLWGPTGSRLRQVPNSGDATTDESGAFAIRPVPVSSSWFVVADVDNKRLATIFRPNIKKEVEVELSLASTMAVAGVMPFFIEDPKAPERPVYDLRDLAPDLFDELVAAIKKANPEIKPGKELKELNTPFNTLKDKDQGVKNAFEALFADIKANAQNRQAGGSTTTSFTPTPPIGGSAPPTSGSPSPTQGGTSPSPSPGSSPVASPTGSPGASASPGPTTSPSPTPTPYLPKAKVATLGESTGGSPRVEVGPGQDKVSIAMAANGVATGAPNVSGTTTFVDDTTKLAKAVAFDNGVTYYLIDNTIVFNDRTITLTGLEAGDTTDLAIKGGFAYVTANLKNSIYKVDLGAAGTTTLFAGDPVAVASFANATNPLDARFNGPNGIVIDGETIYVADTYNRRIRAITVTGTVSTLAGSSVSGAADAVGEAATFQAPADLTVDDTGNLYVVDNGNHNVRRIASGDHMVTTLINPTRARSDIDGTGATATLNTPISVSWGKVFGVEFLVIGQTNKKIRIATGW